MVYVTIQIKPLPRCFHVLLFISIFSQNEMTTLVSKKKGEVNEFCELTSFILPAGVLLLSAMNDVAAQRADPTPLERRRLGLAPCSSRVSTACKTNT